MNRRERRANARISQKTTNGSEASTPGALYETGLAHLQAGQLLNAQACCQRALALDPRHADTLHLMGLIHLQDNQYEFAIEWIARAIRQGPPKPAYLWNLGAALHKQGRYEEALKTFDKAVQIQPDDADLWKNLSEVLIALDRRDEAILGFQHALKLNPRHWAAADKCGHLFFQLKRFEEALVHFNLCDELRPNRALTLRMRALTLHRLHSLDESLTDNRRAFELDPTDPETCGNLGDVLRSPSVADMIRHLMDQHGLTRADMVPMLGTPSRVSEVLSGKKGLSMTMVQRLRARFRVPAELLLPQLKKAGSPRSTRRAVA